MQQAFELAGSTVDSTQQAFSSSLREGVAGRSTCGVFSSTMMAAVRGSAVPHPGKSSSSRITAARSAWASASSGLLCRQADRSGYHVCTSSTPAHMCA